jgi:hypothetical protein
MKKIITLSFLLFITIPYCLQWYGFLKLNNSLKESMVSFNTYQEGWYYLERSKLFPFWKKNATEHQKSFCLQTKILFFEERINCQINVEKKISDWLEEDIAIQSNNPITDTLNNAFLIWKQKGEDIDNLPPKLQQQIITIYNSEYINFKEKWLLFSNWASNQNKTFKLHYLNQIPSRIILEEHLIQLKLDYNINYLTKGY